MKYMKPSPRSNRTVTIGVVDNLPIVRQGISHLISTINGYKVVAEAANCTDMVRCAEQAPIPPEIIVIDIDEMKESGAAVKELKLQLPLAKLIVLSSITSDYIMAGMIKGGVNSFMGKSCTALELETALHALCSGTYYYPDYIARRMNGLHLKEPVTAPKITGREMEFLELCCSDLSYKEISEKMSVSVRTVEAFRNALFTKFKIKSRTGLAMYALQSGLVSLS